MDEWLDRLADTLEAPRLSPEELGTLLKVARDVAHGVERRFAPLSTFLLGVAVGQRRASGGDLDRAFGSVVEAVRGMLPQDTGGSERD